MNIKLPVDEGDENNNWGFHLKGLVAKKVEGGYHLYNSGSLIWIVTPDNDTWKWHSQTTNGISYCKDKNLESFHRLDGPAFQDYKKRDFYYVDGQELSKEEFITLTKLLSTGDRETVTNLIKI